MEKKELYQYVGSMEQLAYIRSVTYGNGRSSGMKAYEVKNGCLEFQVMEDKCLDVSGLAYKGINMSFLSKPGLQGRNHYDTNGQEALRSIMGGLFFTAGLENICAPYVSEGKEYPMHGRIRTTPAEHVYTKAAWEDGKYKLMIGGEMREAELFGENMVLSRKIESVYGESSLLVTDTIENESFREEPMMLLYHINLGYPFLDQNLRLYIPTRKVTARDKASEGHEENYDRMDDPKENEPEYVFIHELMADQEKNTWLLAVNPVMQLGLKLEFNKKNLPYFMEWKSTASGDYVIGLEPSNSSVYGREYHEKKGNLHKLKPFEKETTWLRFTILDGKCEIDQAVKAFNSQFVQEQK